MAQRRAADLTVEERASITSGASFWTTQSIERLAVPSITVADGPHGLRKQEGASDHLGIAESVPATCFPAAVALAGTFDAALAERVGNALGEECRAEDVAVLLGPAINIKRSPLCGRNFEYFSEDPLVAGELGAGLVRGIQAQGVGACVKHFAANNQETDRFRVSADVDARPLREIYLRPFERIVHDAHPWTFMCSYNRINGVAAAEDRWLLTELLRGEWGFDGLVMSDWGAVGDRVAALGAGLDLEMPSTGGHSNAVVVDAVREGRLEESALDRSAQRVLDLVSKAEHRRPGVADLDGHHALAREVASRSIVLLKNDEGVLPLAPQAKVAVIGEFARTPRFQGGGSSHIAPTRIDAALDAIRALGSSGGGTVEFAPGFPVDDSGDAAARRAEAVEAARSAEVAVVFLGLPEEAESEGLDRVHLDLPCEQLELIDAVVAANPNTVAVLSNGAAVAIPFRKSVPAIVEGWLLGQAGGGAIADVLYGVVNPSAKLAETIPLRLEDTAAFGNFPGELGRVRYGEGVLVGYRWYDARGLEVAYPFGHGLSYTSFGYGDAAAENAATENAATENAPATDAAALDAYGKDADTLGPRDIVVRVPITNLGRTAGREIVQAYVSPVGPSRVQRPPRELKAFASVALEPGETREVALRIRRDDLAYWDVRVNRWVVEGGEYRIEVGSSSRDVRATTTVYVDEDPLLLPFTLGSTVGEVLADPVARPHFEEVLGDALAPLSSAGEGGGIMSVETFEHMMASFPIDRLVAFSGGAVSPEDLSSAVATANAHRTAPQTTDADR